MEQGPMQAETLIGLPLEKSFAVLVGTGQEE